MGEFNSSLTRVRPVVNGLLEKDASGRSWLTRLLEMAIATRPVAINIADPGSLLESETPDLSEREGKVFERIVPPPTAFLHWLIENPEHMDLWDPRAFGATSEDARNWRRKLFSASPGERNEAQLEARRCLGSSTNKGSARKWWAFEGFSHVDSCLITERLVLFVEGKRTESVSPATRWFKQRSQLWRNVEAAREFAAGKEFAVIVAVEDVEHGREALRVADSTLAGSFPHLSADERQPLSKHLLGYVTWSGIVRELGLAKGCLIDRVVSARRVPRAT